MEEAVENAVSSSPNPNDLSNIVKGKRTKRMRPHSPVPFNVAPLTHSSSINNCNIIINYSPPSMEEEEEGGGMAANINNQVDEEDEEMANCLILLSQGNPIKISPNYNNGGEKFTSKRYIETPISSNGKAGMYVYQCKTCGRTFPSFQALGGHRASHKKPKNMAAAAAAAAEAKKVPELSSAFTFSDDEEEAFMIKNYKSKKPPTLSLELSNWNCEFSNSEVKNKSHHQLKKIHECSYCGAQFSSGQALGGHMRRHRGVPVTAVAPATPSTNTTLSLSPFPISPASINQDSSDQDDEGKKRRNELSLDLNLPAPEDHDHHLHTREAKTALSTKHQQIQQKKPDSENKPELGPDPNLVLSTGRFVECRY